MNFILNVKVLTDMYFNIFTGLVNFEGEPSEFVQETVEKCLERFEKDKLIGQIPSDIVIPEFYEGSFLTKRYSTKPHLTDVTSLDLHGECFEESDFLRMILEHYDGIMTQVVKSNYISPYKGEIFKHFFLSVVIASNEIIIEPTLGQFLTNYKGIFVGTREDLRRLFILTLKDNPTLFSSRWSYYRELVLETPSKMFEVIWGTRSIEV